jgi:hypothetical protein
VIVVELWPGKRCQGKREMQALENELLELARANPLTEDVDQVLLHPRLPVDIRHNAKIFREKLAEWVKGQV